MKRKEKEVEMKVIVLNPEALGKARETFTKNIYKAYKQSLLTTEKRG